MSDWSRLSTASQPLIPRQGGENGLQRPLGRHGDVVVENRAPPQGRTLNDVLPDDRNADALSANDQTRELSSRRIVVRTYAPPSEAAQDRKELLADRVKRRTTLRVEVLKKTLIPRLLAPDDSPSPPASPMGDLDERLFADLASGLPPGAMEEAISALADMSLADVARVFRPNPFRLIRRYGGNELDYRLIPALKLDQAGKAELSEFLALHRLMSRSEDWMGKAIFDFVSAQAGRIQNKSTFFRAASEIRRLLDQCGPFYRPIRLLRAACEEFAGRTAKGEVESFVKTKFWELLQPDGPQDAKGIGSDDAAAPSPSPAPQDIGEEILPEGDGSPDVSEEFRTIYAQHFSGLCEEYFQGRELQVAKEWPQWMDPSSPLAEVDWLSFVDHAFEQLVQGQNSNDASSNETRRRDFDTFAWSVYALHVSTLESFSEEPLEE